MGHGGTLLDSGLPCHTAVEVEGRVDGFDEWL